MHRANRFRTAAIAILTTVLAVALFGAASAGAAGKSGGKRAGAAGGQCANARIAAAEHPRAALTATLCLVNRERAARGLVALHADRALARAARGHSNDMVARRFFDHTAPGNVTFVERIRRARYAPGGAWSVGENLAWGSGGLAQPLSIVRGWMRSPGHRANILNGGFRAIGIGIARGIPVAAAASLRRSGATYTTTFGSR